MTAGGCRCRRGLSWRGGVRCWGSTRIRTIRGGRNRRRRWRCCDLRVDWHWVDWGGGVPNLATMPHPATWLKVLPNGLYCEPGGFFIDPLRPVDKAVITHAHSDHARPGHHAVLASAATLALMRARLGDWGGSPQALGWHEP